MERGGGVYSFVDCLSRTISDHASFGMGGGSTHLLLALRLGTKSIDPLCLKKSWGVNAACIATVYLTAIFD